MARDRDERLASLTFLAAQTDFSDAGELTLFINESEVALIEDMMRERGYLEAAQMAGAFALLRSNDLIRSRVVNDYLMGERSQPIDIMAWNDDSTRMPARMHSQYLRALFLDNDLAAGRFEVGGRRIALHDIRAPIFAVGTERDHVAPWRSVFKFHLFADEVTFVLTKGGHNAGILSEPGHPHRHFRLATKSHDEAYVDPDIWLARTPPREGSWWPALSAWVAARSGEKVAPPPVGRPGTRFATDMSSKRSSLVAGAAIAALALTCADAAAQPAWGPGMMMGPGMMGAGAFGFMCNPRAAGFAEWRIARIEAAVRPTEAQRTALNELRAASTNAADTISAACTSDFPAKSTERLAAMEKRVEAMLQAIKTVRPAFDTFYASLDDQQKARLDGIGPRRWGWRGWRWGWGG
jgi:hypothetical protein